MIQPISIDEATAALAREPLRNVVLLKHLAAYPEHAKVHRASSAAGSAYLLVLPASASAYDRHTYPAAALVALVSSDHADLTAALVQTLPRDVGIVFKLAGEEDLFPVAKKFSVTRRTAFISFTGTGGRPDAAVRLTTTPGEVAFDLFGSQGHKRTWLEPALASGKAFACLLEVDGVPRSVCLALESYGPVWEVGGVVTMPSHRQKGLGARVVGVALAELARRGLTPRYQVEENNAASVRLARSVGLAPFLTLTHHEHRP